MKEDKISVVKLVLEPYVLDILKELSKSPKRFSALSKICKNERTLSKKLRLLEESELLENTPLKVGNKYVNSYTITSRGKSILKAIMSL